jgi:hypothetical protein
MTTLQIPCSRWLAGVAAALLLSAATGLAAAAPTLTWRTDRVDANLKNCPLPKLLEQIAAESGWQVFVEPGAEYTASTKFKDLPVQDALRMLLGKLNFAVVPQTGAPARLYVFHTSMNQATQLIRPTIMVNLKQPLPPTIVADELILRLKPGVKIEDIARALGAKVIGKIDELNAYRLKFDNADSATAARETLVGNTDIASVENNYVIDQPAMPQPLLASSAPPLTLQPKAPPASGRMVVGLVDTAIQSLGSQLDVFIEKPVSITGDAVPLPNTPTHATSMAETILRSLQDLTGGSTSTRIKPYDAYGNQVTTTSFATAVAITQAVNDGCNPINLSFGSQADSPVLHDVITQATKQGVVMFAAAGNQPVATPTYPAAYSEVTAVTAGDAQKKIASYANFGSFVDAIAPGTSVVDFQGQQYLVAGTSAATAYASGMAAAIAEVKSASLTEVQAAMRQKLAPTTSAPTTTPAGASPGATH